MAECGSPISLLEQFVSREVMRAGMRPLRGSAVLAVILDGEKTVTLRKRDGVPVIEAGSPENPDFTVRMPTEGLRELCEKATDDLGSTGVLLVSLFTHEDAGKKFRLNVHLGPMGFVTKGYIGVIPLGGATLMRALASRGLGSLGAIKNAISRLREDK